ncbi:ChbG/HpnK family deacetylase [Sphingomonas sp.]|uniref:ChbG/HpnK family deacetylase n=1 Tax=Sphingomonas sp. TaxID=28214 RepID=UPI003CC5DC9A
MSETIADLLGAGKLNATSCMTTMPGWPADAALLRRIDRPAQIGLHLTLTGERPLTATPMLAPDGVLPRIDPLTWAAMRGRLPLAEIAAEVAAQFDAFAAAMGRAPDFVDGHQHAHALPGVRDIVLAETAQRAPDAWLRDCTDTVAGMLARPFRGKAIGSAFHSRGFARAVAAHGLRCNDGFSGHYDFAGDYGALFPRFLRRPGAVHLVMCHPGRDAPAGDAIAAARVVEAEALGTLPVVAVAAAAGLVFAA